MSTRMEMEAEWLADEQELDPATLITVFTILQQCWSTWHVQDPEKQHRKLCRRYENQPDAVVRKAARRVREDMKLSEEESLKYAKASVEHAIAIGPDRYMEAVR